MKTKYWFSALLLTGILLTLLLNCKNEVATGEEDMVPLYKKGPVYDIDQNAYNTVTIGTQEWFATNLKTTRYNYAR